MRFIQKKGIFLSLLFLFFINFAYSIEECNGETIVSDDVPCLILLPYDGNCAKENVSVFNSTDKIYEIPLTNYTGSQCSFSFNQSKTNKTYTFLYSTKDTGNILVEVNNMIDIFHVLVYSVLGLLGLAFIVFMHIFQEDDTSIVYGFLSGAVWLVIAVINISGFHLIRGVTFIIDVNYYITALAVILIVYTGVASYFFYKNNYKPKQNPYALRQ